MRLGPCIGILLSACLGLPAQESAAREQFGRLATQLRKDLEKQGIVGGSFWLLRGDRVLDRMFHGYADLESKRKVDAQTIFHWASVTKTLTGIAWMQLRDRGRTKLDDKILRWVPGLRQVHGNGHDVGRITIEHLLSHAAGFRANTFPFAGGEDWQPYEPRDFAQLAAMFPYTRLLFRPGTKFSYSNPGIVFVGRVIEELSGDDFEVYVDKNILKPLGMHSSYFDNNPFHLARHRSNNYRLVDGKMSANGLDLDTGVTVSNGGLNAPIPDMHKYLAFLVGAAPEGPAREVLGRDSLGEMWTPRQSAGLQGKSQRSMGLSFFIYALDGRKIVGHTGSQRGFQCFVLCDPRTGAAAVAAFNSPSTSADPEWSTRSIMMRLMNELLETVFPRFAEDLPVGAHPAVGELNSFVVKVLQDYPTDGTHGYHWPKEKQVTWGGNVRELRFGGELLAEGDPEGRCFCCGLTFEVWLQAAQRWAKANKRELVVPGFNSIAELKKLRGQWFGSDGDKRCSEHALSDNKLGRRITDLEEAKAGDFVQLWRHSGSGHSVIFSAWVRRNGKIVGLRYWSTQKSTKGIGYHTEYFGGKRGIDTAQLYITRAGIPE